MIGYINLLNFNIYKCFTFGSIYTVFFLNHSKPKYVRSDLPIILTCILKLLISSLGDNQTFITAVF